MKHGEVKNHLADYLEGDLPLGDRALVDAHLDGCAECAQEVDDLLQTVGFLRRLPEPEPPPMISANVMRRIRAGETTPTLLERITRSLGAILEPGFMLPASAIAAAALVVAIVQEPGLLSRFSDFAAGNDSTSPAVLADAGDAALTDQNGSERMVVFGGGDPTGGALRGRSEAGSVLGGGASRMRPLLASAAPSPFLLPFAGTAPNGGSGSQASGGQGFAQLEPGASPSTIRYRIQLRSPSLEREFGLASSGFTSRAAEPGQLARGVVDPRTLRVADSLFAPDRGAQRVAQPFRLDQGASSFAGDSAGAGGPAGADGSAGVAGPDTWLARGMADPAGFADFLSRKSIAEQELWVAHLAARAESRGLLDELVAGLRESGDPTARVLGDDFAAEAEKLTAALAAESAETSAEASSVESGAAAGAEASRD